MPDPDRSPPRPLDEAESALVRRWQHMMYGYFFLAMLVIAGLYWVANRFGDSPTARWLVLAGVVVLVAAASVVQFSGKCPRCNTRLGRQARLVLPGRCRVCGVEFPRP
jgi:apolipoprotein N-acyltransferase